MAGPTASGQHGTGREIAQVAVFDPNDSTARTARGKRGGRSRAGKSERAARREALAFERAAREHAAARGNAKHRRDTSDRAFALVTGNGRADLPTHASYRTLDAQVNGHRHADANRPHAGTGRVGFNESRRASDAAMWGGEPRERWSN